MLILFRSTLILFFVVIATSLSSQIVEIESTTDGFLPPRMTTTQRDAITVSPASDGMIIYNESTGLLNYYDGLKGIWLVIRPSPCDLFIGMNYEGGRIFYLDASGCHGLIAAPSDQSAGIQWYNGTFVDTYAYGNGIGAGEGNSQGIRRWQGFCSSCYANELCRDLSLGGYSDWYLPSKYELNLMFENIGQGNALGLGNVGGFTGGVYWSSTELNANEALVQQFGTGLQDDSVKSTDISRVRAIRAF